MKSLNIKIIAVFLFLLSGICGLIYEVTWSKYLALFIGSTAWSHMIVLATYMGGLALGSFALGKYADRISNQLKLYGLLELGIGVYCLAYPFLIEAAGEFFIHTASFFEGTSQKGVLLLLRFVLSFVTLFPPTILMGGTLPILAKFLSKSISDSGKNVAKLYYSNSLGAVFGAVLAGFFLIRSIGLDHTVWIASLLNIFIGLSALLLAKFVNSNIPLPVSSNIKEDTSQQDFSENSIRIAVFTALASGFIAMLYELTWIRLLSNILGSTTYSFTVMLIAFISGITLGSLIVSLVIKKIKNLISFLAICQYGTAVSMILTLPLYERLPYYLMKVSAMIPNKAENFPAFLGLEFLFCFLIMLVPTIFSGMSLPVASRIANRDMRFLGKSVGGIFSINTIGSVAGVLITGLVIIPYLGVKLSMEFGVLLNGMLGLFILFKTGLSRRVKMVFILSFVMIAAGYKIFFPSWNENFLISGVFRTLYTQEVPSYSEFKNQQNQGQKILWHKDGLEVNVAVRESQFEDTIQKTLVINGKVDASTVADLQTQILLCQLPLMLYPDSGDALVIGLGSGITCGSVLRHPVNSLDVVEIASEVVKCNEFFAKENDNFMTDARVKIFIDDAITHLKTTSKKYYYIISEPSNPWIAGIANLYSSEFFKVCKARLNSNGVLTQWFHTYDVTNDIFGLVLKTITEVFPYVTIWKASDADIIILASPNPPVPNFKTMELKMSQPQIAHDLSRIKIYDLPTLLSTQVVSARNNPFSFIKNDQNTVKKPLLEFLAPVALFTHESVSVLDSLDERFAFQDKNLWFSEYMKMHPLSFENCINIARYRLDSPHIGDLALAYTAVRKGLETEPGNNLAQTMMQKITDILKLPDASSRKAQIEHMRMMYELNPNDNSAIMEYLNSLVEYYRIENSIINPQLMDDAVELMKRSIQNSDGQEQFQYILAMIYTGAGRYEEAAEAFGRLMQLQEKNGAGSSMLSKKELIFSIGESYYNAGNLSEAQKYFELLKSADPGSDQYLVMQRKIALKKSGIK